MSRFWPICDDVPLRSVKLFSDEFTDGWINHPLARLAIAAAECQANRTRFGAFLGRHDTASGIQVFSCRVARGSSGPVTIYNHSEHAHATAVDIRPKTNPQRKDGRIQTELARFSVADGASFVLSFMRCGFRWGGSWTTLADYSSGAAARTHIEKILRGTWRDGKPVPKFVQPLTGSYNVDPHHYELAYGPTGLRAREASLRKLAAACS